MFSTLLRVVYCGTWMRGRCGTTRKKKLQGKLYGGGAPSCDGVPHIIRIPKLATSNPVLWKTGFKTGPQVSRLQLRQRRLSRGCWRHRGLAVSQQARKAALEGCIIYYSVYSCGMNEHLGWGGQQSRLHLSSGYNNNAQYYYVTCSTTGCAAPLQNVL